MPDEKEALAAAKAKALKAIKPPKWVIEAGLEYRLSRWSSQHIAVPLRFKYRLQTQTVWVTLNLAVVYLESESPSYDVIQVCGRGRGCHAFAKGDMCCYVLMLPNEIKSLADLNLVKDELQSLIDRDWWGGK